MKAIAEWIWIAAGVIAGLIIFSIAQNQIYQLNIATIEQRSLEQFYEVRNIINNLCWSFVGNTREYTLNLGESVEGIYASRDKYTEYKRDELIGSISKGKISEGNFLCIKIKNKRLKCEELECNATIPFVGSLPIEFSLSALVNKLLGKGETFTYELVFNRTVELVAVNKKI
jgi:hypothetical protein